MERAENTIVQSGEQFTFPVDTRVLREARVHLRRFFEPLGFQDTVVDDAIVAADEALTNAIQHGSCNVDSVSMRLSSFVDRVEVEISDNGRGEPGLVPDDCDPLSTSGRGLWLMENLVDEVHFQQKNQCGTIVTLVINKLH